MFDNNTQRGEGPSQGKRPKATGTSPHPEKSKPKPGKGKGKERQMETSLDEEEVRHIPQTMYESSDGFSGSSDGGATGPLPETICIGKRMMERIMRERGAQGPAPPDANRPLAEQIGSMAQAPTTGPSTSRASANWKMPQRRARIHECSAHPSQTPLGSNITTNLIGGPRPFRLQNWRHARLNSNGHVSIRETDSHWEGNPSSLWTASLRDWSTGHHYQLVREASMIPLNQ